MRQRDRLLEPARLAMRGEALPASAKICEVVPAALGESIDDVAPICVGMAL